MHGRKDRLLRLVAALLHTICVATEEEEEETAKEEPQRGMEVQCNRIMTWVGGKIPHDKCHDGDRA